MNALKTNKFKVGDEVEIVSLQGTDGIGYRGDCPVMVGATGVVTEVTDVIEGDMPYEVETNGEAWSWSGNNLKLVNEVTSTSQNESIKETIKSQHIQSDGGSSDYYFTKLPQELIDQIVKTGGIEIKDIARYVYDNNADAFNIIKAQKRIIEANKGVGKAGITKLYDAKKISFFANEQLEAIKREGNNG